jgi:hypothetical protein
MSDQESEPKPAEQFSKEGRCPRCGKSFKYRSAAAHKPFPFCSPRCREVDLGNWLTGRYVIPGAQSRADDERDEDAADLPPDAT